MSNLVEHARRELKLLGEDPGYAQSIVAAVAAFASYGGHSGASAEIARHQLHTLLAFGNLTPLTNAPDEWHNVTDEGGGSTTPLWQNRRNSACFSNDGGKTYWSVNDPRDDDGELPRYTSSSASKEVSS